MPTIESIANFLEHFAPSRLAEDWDNVGLLVGDPRHKASRVMTCLTITPAVAAEAVAQDVDLIVSHHPLPFRALKRLTADTTTGRILLELIAAEVAVYSPHTAFDSAADGINERLARGLELRGVMPLVFDPAGQGIGRAGWLEQPLRLVELADRVKRFLSIDRVQTVGHSEQSIRTVAIGCGAADDFLQYARREHADAMLLGEARYHTCLEAEALGIALVLPGHYASERFAIECLAQVMAEHFAEVAPHAEIQFWASREERDPICWR